MEIDSSTYGQHWRLISAQADIKVDHFLVENEFHLLTAGDLLCFYFSTKSKIVYKIVFWQKSRNSDLVTVL